jgi:glycosyltransferase involved in cell wall biosynthesis
MRRQSDPLVTVITPCFRQGHLLPEAIACVLNQSYQSVEMVVVNDGSDDDTEAVTRRYGNAIRYVRQENAGLSAARNSGLRVAEGRYVLFLDADDLLHPEAISWLVEAVGGVDNALGIMGFRVFTSNPDVGEDFVHPAYPLLPTLLHVNHAPPMVYLAPTRMVRAAGGFWPGARYGCEDWDLWIRLALDGATPRFVPRVGGLYRRHPGTMSTKYVLMHWARTEVLARAHQAILERPDLAPWRSEIPGLRERIANYSFRAARGAARRGWFALAARSLARLAHFRGLSVTSRAVGHPGLRRLRGVGSPSGAV